MQTFNATCLSDLSLTIVAAICKRSHCHMPQQPASDKLCCNLLQAKPLKDHIEWLHSDGWEQAAAARKELGCPSHLDPIGRTVWLWCFRNRRYRRALVESYDERKQRHTIRYDDDRRLTNILLAEEDLHFEEPADLKRRVDPTRFPTDSGSDVSSGPLTSTDGDCDETAGTYDDSAEVGARSNVASNAARPADRPQAAMNPYAMAPDGVGSSGPSPVPQLQAEAAALLPADVPQAQFVSNALVRSRLTTSSSGVGNEASFKTMTLAELMAARKPNKAKNQASPSLSGAGKSPGAHHTSAAAPPAVKPTPHASQPSSPAALASPSAMGDHPAAGGSKPATNAVSSWLGLREFMHAGPAIADAVPKEGTDRATTPRSGGGSNREPDAARKQAAAAARDDQADSLPVRAADASPGMSPAGVLPETAAGRLQLEPPAALQDQDSKCTSPVSLTSPEQLPACNKDLPLALGLPPPLHQQPAAAVGDGGTQGTHSGQHGLLSAHYEDGDGSQPRSHNTPDGNVSSAVRSPPPQLPPGIVPPSSLGAPALQHSPAALSPGRPSPENLAIELSSDSSDPPVAFGGPDLDGGGDAPAASALAEQQQQQLQQQEVAGVTSSCLQRSSLQEEHVTAEMAAADLAANGYNGDPCQADGPVHGSSSPGALVGADRPAATTEEDMLVKSFLTEIDAIPGPEPDAAAGQVAPSPHEASDLASNGMDRAGDPASASDGKDQASPREDMVVVGMGYPDASHPPQVVVPGTQQAPQLPSQGAGTQPSDGDAGADAGADAVIDDADSINWAAVLEGELRSEDPQVCLEAAQLLLQQWEEDADFQQPPLFESLQPLIAEARDIVVRYADLLPEQQQLPILSPRGGGPQGSTSPMVTSPERAAGGVSDALDGQQPPGGTAVSGAAAGTALTDEAAAGRNAPEGYRPLCTLELQPRGVSGAADEDTGGGSSAANADEAGRASQALLPLANALLVDSSSPVSSGRT